MPSAFFQHTHIPEIPAVIGEGSYKQVIHESPPPLYSRLTTVMKLVEGHILLMVTTTALIATPSMTAGCSGMRT